jgi:hypothetical protein
MGKIKPKKEILFKEIITTIQNSPVTIVAVGLNAAIKACIPLKEDPSSLETFDKILRSHIKSDRKGKYAVSLVSQDKKYSKNKLLQLINSSIEALQYSKTHKLESGVNIPGNKKYYALRKKLEKEIKKKKIAEMSKNKNVSLDDSSINLN